MPFSLVGTLYIGIFGLLGVLARHFFVLFSIKIPIHGFLATLTVNLLGAFFIGVIYVLGEKGSVLDPNLRLGLAIGFLGGFTTFSSYVLESLVLLQRGELLVASAYLGLSPVLGLGFVYLGTLAARTLLGAR